MSKQLLLGDEAIAQAALDDFQVFMPILVLLQLKLRNIFKWPQ
jgi:hypothetical protein